MINRRDITLRTVGLVLGGAWVLASCGAPHGEDIVASYDNGAITKQEFDSYLRSLDTDRLGPDVDLSAEEDLKEILRDFAVAKILAAEVEGLETLQKPVLFIDLKARYLVGYYRERIGGRRNQSVSDEEARDFYEEHLAARFTLPESIRFQHIYLRSDRHTASDLRDLEQKIQAEYARGVPFGELVARYSESDSREYRGIVGPVFRGRLDEDFEEGLFALEVSDQSSLIRTETGSHVVLVLEKNDARTRPFDQAKPEIVSDIISRREEAARQRHLQALRQRYEVIDLTADRSLRGDAVVIRIEDRELTADQLEEYLEKAEPFGAGFARLDPRSRQAMIADLIDGNLMYLDAISQGFDTEQDFVEMWQIREIGLRARAALQQHVDRWVEALDDNEVLAFYGRHESRFVEPRRLDTSYIFLPFGDRSPLELKVAIEELRRVAAREGFGSRRLLDACAAQEASCIDAGFLDTKQAARVGPKFQQTLFAMEEPGISEPFRIKNGLCVVGVHAIEESRPLKPPEDMSAIRARYAELERRNIGSTIKDRVLEEHRFGITASLTVPVEAED